MSDEIRERVAGVLREHQTAATGLGVWCCSCSPGEWRGISLRSGHVADALLPLVAEAVDKARAEGDSEWRVAHDRDMRNLVREAVDKAREEGRAEVRERVEATGWREELSEFAEFVKVETGHAPTHGALSRLRRGLSAALRGDSDV